jgi:hypothetical protein
LGDSSGGRKEEEKQKGNIRIPATARAENYHK